MPIYKFNDFIIRIDNGRNFPIFYAEDIIHTMQNVDIDKVTNDVRCRYLNRGILTYSMRRKYKVKESPDVILLTITGLYHMLSDYNLDEFAVWILNTLDQYLDAEEVTEEYKKNVYELKLLNGFLLNLFNKNKTHIEISLEKVDVDSCVYFITNCTYKNKVKIGYTKTSLVQRLSQIQEDVGCALSVYAFYISEAPYKIEQFLHEKYAHKRRNGEWFEFTKEELDEVVGAFQAVKCLNRKY